MAFVLSLLFRFLHPSYYIATFFFIYIFGTEQQAGGHDIVEMVEGDGWLESASMMKNN